MRLWPIGWVGVLLVGCTETHVGAVDEAQGLDLHAPVVREGVIVGEVTKIAFKNELIGVVFELDSGHPLKEDDCLTVLPYGKKQVAAVILPGKGGPLKPHAVLEQCSPERYDAHLLSTQLQVSFDEMKRAVGLKAATPEGMNAICSTIKFKLSSLGSLERPGHPPTGDHWYRFDIENTRDSPLTALTPTMVIHDAQGARIDLKDAAAFGGIPDDPTAGMMLPLTVPPHSTEHTMFVLPAASNAPHDLVIQAMDANGMFCDLTANFIAAPAAKP